MDIRRVRKVGNILAGLENIRAVRPKVSYSSLAKSALILIILLIVFCIRLLPISIDLLSRRVRPLPIQAGKYIVEWPLRRKRMDLTACLYEVNYPPD